MKKTILIFLIIYFAMPLAAYAKIHKTKIDSLPEFQVGSSEDMENKVFLLNRLGYGFNHEQLQEISQEPIGTWLIKQLNASNANLPQNASDYLKTLHINQVPENQLFDEFKTNQEKIKEMKKEAADNNNKNGLNNDLDKSVMKNSMEKEALEQRKEYTQEVLEENFVYSLYGNNLLQNSMTDFWLNHFSVFSRKQPVEVFLGSYEKTIRANALGNFKDLLREVMTSPAMLIYLDNRQNTGDNPYMEAFKIKHPDKVQGINENYAREFLELHTMGINSGYTQDDVQELAKIFTGLGVNLNPNENFKMAPELQPLIITKGFFFFDPRRHDFTDKKFLGYTIKGSGYSEAEQVLDIICSSPKTAHFITKKIATFYVSDQPSDKLVDAMSKTFLKSNGSIQQVLMTMFNSKEFWLQKSKHGKFKAPYQYMISTLKPLVNEQVIINYRPLINNINNLGGLPFSKQTPQGFGMTEKDWVSSDQLEKRLEISTDLKGLLKRSMQDPPTHTAINNPFNLDEINDNLKIIVNGFTTKNKNIIDQAPIDEKYKLIFGSPDWMYY